MAARGRSVKRTECRELLTESADVRSLADDDVFHRVEELRACGVRGEVERLAQRIELEHVVMVSGTGGSINVWEWAQPFGSKELMRVRNRRS